MGQPTYHFMPGPYGLSYSYVTTYKFNGDALRLKSARIEQISYFSLKLCKEIQATIRNVRGHSKLIINAEVYEILKA